MSLFPRSSIALFFFFAVSAVASGAQAPSVCPWLAVGTAARSLGGDVTLSVHAEGTANGSCLFSRSLGHGTESLEILVASTDPHACPAGSTALKAIGNEASQCQSSSAQNERVDIVAGRVRDAYFVVRMTNVPDAAQPESGLPRNSEQFGASLIEKIAEQVSEALY